MNDRLAWSLTLLLALAGCGRSAQPGAEPGAGATEAAIAPVAGPTAKPGTSLSDARLTLPAVAGRPGALYFTLRNAGAAPATLAAVQIDGAAQTELHDSGAAGMMAPIKSVTVPAAGTVAFAPGGRHVMAFDLAATLRPGGRTGVTLVFADGDKLSGEAAVVAPGAGADGAMSGPTHAPQ